MIDGDRFAVERVDHAGRRPVGQRIDGAVSRERRVEDLPAAPVEIDRDAGPQLMLDAGAILQVGLALEVRIERTVRDLPEVRIVARTDFVVLGNAVAVGGEAAAGEIDVGPRPRIGERGDRVEQVRERADVGRHDRPKFAFRAVLPLPKRS